MPEADSNELDQRALGLFEQLADLSAEEQQTVLARCDDAAVRDRVARMLDCDREGLGLLDAEAGQHLACLANEVVDSPPPERIGPFRILERLGQGGMAVVYRACRTDTDFDQQVALKLILPSHIGAHWHDRFLRERRILARLQHPNIARLLDGGMGESGQPYFAMEYVDGVPITDYCDRRQLSIGQRLALFLKVCEAVHYAHRNLIVHRDLKPSNILVDLEGEVKLLDFGIAKLLVDQADTALTTTGQRVMTPDYAAPEQFQGTAITTATDVYALGILLFEMLCGQRPFAAEQAAEIERKVTTETPPSLAKFITSRLSADKIMTVSQARRLSPAKLKRVLQGDLNNVIAMTLRKEAERRYPSAQALAEDIQRYLRGLPVQARPDSLSYHLGKFVRRHRIGVAFTGLAVAVLLLASGVALWQARQAAQAMQRAQIEADKAGEISRFLIGMFEYANPDQSLGERVTARQILDLGAKRIEQELGAQPALRGAMMHALAKTYRQLGLYGQARVLAEQAAATQARAGDPGAQAQALIESATVARLQGLFDQAQARLTQAQALLDGGGQAALRAEWQVERAQLARELADYETATAAIEQALRIDRSIHPGDHLSVARDLYIAATLKVTSGDNEQAETLLKQAAEMLQRLLGVRHTRYAQVRHDLGVLLIQMGQLERAETVLSEVRSIRRELLGDQHPDLAVTIKELAGIARQRGQPQQAEQLYLDALAIMQGGLGQSHPETANLLNSLAVFYHGTGRIEAAVEHAQQALTVARAAYGERHPTVATMGANLGSLMRVAGRLDEARIEVEKALNIHRESLGEDHQMVAVSLNSLAAVLYLQGQLQQAEAHYRQAAEIFSAAVGDRHPHLISIRSGWASTLADLDQLEPALQQFEAAAAIADQVLPPEHPNVAIVQLGRAGVLARLGRCAEAQSLSDTFWPRIEGSPLSQRPNLQKAMQALANCHDV